MMVVGHILWRLEMHEHLDSIPPFLERSCLSYMLPLHFVAVAAKLTTHTVTLLFLNPAKTTSDGNRTSVILKLPYFWIDLPLPIHNWMVVSFHEPVDW
jgi:hypothetical protein